MENEITNNEVIDVENENEVTDLTVPETEIVHDENENSGIGTMALGIGVCGLAAVGAVALCKLTYKHVLKPVGHKIKNAFSKGKSDKSDVSEVIAVECDDVEEDTDTEE